MNDGKSYQPGQPLCDWLYTEPAALDVSGLYDNNYTVPTQPYQPFWDRARREAERLVPRESGAETVLGLPVHWRRLRLSEGDVMPTWAVYGTHATLLQNYAYCEVTAAKAGPAPCALTCSGAAAVILNGAPCLEDYCFRRVGSRELAFTMELKEGKNTLLLILMNVHLHSANSFSLKFPETEVRVSLPLIETENRDLLERDFQAFYIKETVMTEGLTLYTDTPLKSRGAFLFTITQNGGVLSETEFIPDPDSPVRFPIPGTDTLPTGLEYTLTIQFREGPDAPKIQGAAFQFERVCYDTPPKTDYAGRKSTLRKLYGTLTDAPDLKLLYRPLYACLARLICGQPLDTGALESGLAYLNARYDCADFGMHALLRMVYGYPDAIPTKWMAQIKDCILHFKYHEDDGGRSMMFCRSENHRLLFAALEYLAGQLYPRERFSQSGQTGNFHQERGRRTLENWLREKGCFGFMEWHSNTYYEEDIIALLNLCDFAAEYDSLRLRAGNLLDLIAYLLASHTSHGILATTHGRCYEKHLLYPATEPIAALTWLLLGTADRLQKQISAGALCLLDSSYHPPAGLEEIAGTEDLETKSRMGLFLQRGMDGADCYTYRCRRYQLSAAMEYRPGNYGQQTHAGQVLLEGEIPVFCSAFENAAPNTRPSYWGGQYRMPRAAATSHTLACLYRIDTPVGLSHCYFPIPMFDETIQNGSWIFGRKGGAYIGVYSQNGFTVTQSGRFKEKELNCGAKDNLWLIQMGTKEEFSSFSSFIAEVSAAQILTDEGQIQYHSPTCGELCYRLDGSCTQNGVPLLDGHYPMIKNPYLYSGYGSGLLTAGDRLLNFRD